MSPKHEAPDGEDVAKKKPTQKAEAMDSIFITVFDQPEKKKKKTLVLQTLMDIRGLELGPAHTM